MPVSVPLFLGSAFLAERASLSPACECVSDRGTSECEVCFMCSVSFFGVERQAGSRAGNPANSHTRPCCAGALLPERPSGEIAAAVHPPHRCHSCMFQCGLGRLTSCCCRITKQNAGTGALPVGGQRVDGDVGDGGAAHTRRPSSVLCVGGLGRVMFAGFCW